MAQLHSVDYWKEILYIVSLKEGAYESIQPSSRVEGMTQKTIKEVWELQKSRKRSGVTAACGRYQFVGDVDDNGGYFKRNAQRAGLNWEIDLFSPINQDKMAVAVIEAVRRITRELILSNPIEAGLRLAKEWASLPVLAPTTGQRRHVERGQSFYTGDGLNSAGVTPEQVEGAFARFLGNQAGLTDFRGLAAANENPALTTAGFGDGGPPTYGDSSATPPAAYNPVVTQRETPLVSIDDMIQLLSPENRVQNRPATVPRITSQQIQDNTNIDYKANLYASPSYKQTTMPPRDTFWGIVTDVVACDKEELALRGAQDVMINYALINNQPDLKPETIAYIYPLIDQSGAPTEYLPENADPKTLAVDRAVKYEAIYDRLSIGAEVSQKIEKDKIVKVRKKGPGMNMLRIIGVVGAPSTIFANLVGGPASAAGAAYGGASPGGTTSPLPPAGDNQSPPARIVGPVGPNVWEGEEAIFNKAIPTTITGITDMVIIPYLATNIVYATTDNFTHSIMQGYKAQKAWCATKYIKNFYRAAKAAYDKGYGLIVYDAYRPFDAQRHMANWADSIDKPCLYGGQGGGCRQMIGSPNGNGSNHNRGAAWDVAMYKIAGGQTVGTVVNSEDFGGPFDNILKPDTAAFYWSGADGQQRENRNKLKQFMLAGGFNNISNEWWHYEIRGGGISAPISGESGWIK